jgi:hypothetical protein
LVSRPKVIYHPRPNSTPDAELDALSAVYALALRRYYQSKGTAEPASESDGCNDAAVVRNTEEVSHVEQRPDRPSETT